MRRMIALVGKQRAGAIGGKFGGNVEMCVVVHLVHHLNFSGGSIFGVLYDALP